MTDYVTSRELRDNARPAIGEEQAAGYWMSRLAHGRASLEDAAASVGNGVRQFIAFRGARD